MKVIGLIAVKNSAAFDEYRNQVTATIHRYSGKVVFRGTPTAMFWNENALPALDAFVEIDFPDRIAASKWAQSPEYQSLLPIRSQAMTLTLIGLE